MLSLIFILTSLNLNAQIYPNPGGTETTCVGSFFDTGRTVGSYANSEDITTTFCSDNGGAISFNFTSFGTELGFDLLKIYDGLDATAPTLHTGLGYSGTVGPGAFTSTGACVTFNFISDANIPDIGWAATISCSVPTEFLNPGGVITTCGGTFYDTGGLNGNYENTESIVTTICPDIATHCLSANFTSFSLESTWDDLKIYDGATATVANLINSYSGTNSPSLVTSTTGDGCLTFEFNSDGGITLSGWVAALTCAPCGTVVCGGSSPICTPFPDACNDACALTLSNPTACPGDGSPGGTVSDIFCLNNTGATAGNPYYYLINCEDGNDMPSPSADVWYSFVATANTTTINITGLNNPSVGIYEGSSCGTMIGRGCDNGSGSLSLLIDPTSPGVTYFLQISGGNLTDFGNFELEVISTWNCANCLVSSIITTTLPDGF